MLLRVPRERLRTAYAVVKPAWARKRRRWLPRSARDFTSKVRPPQDHDFGEPEIRDQNRDRNDHHRARRAVAHPCRTATRCHPEMTSDQRDDGSEERRL